MENPKFNLKIEEENVVLKKQKIEQEQGSANFEGGASEEHTGVDSRKSTEISSAEIEAREKSIEADKKEVRSLKDKLLGIFGQAPDQLKEKYMKNAEERMYGSKTVRANEALRKKYEEFKAEDEAVAEAYKEAIGKWRYVARDENGDFFDTTLYTNAAGEESALKK